MATLCFQALLTDKETKKSKVFIGEDERFETFMKGNGLKLGYVDSYYPKDKLVYSMLLDTLIEYRKLDIIRDDVSSIYIFEFELITREPAYLILEFIKIKFAYVDPNSKIISPYKCSGCFEDNFAGGNSENANTNG